VSSYDLTPYLTPNIAFREQALRFTRVFLKLLFFIMEPVVRRKCVEPRIAIDEMNKYIHSKVDVSHSGRRLRHAAQSRSRQPMKI
jgi:hypothetical protein